VSAPAAAPAPDPVYDLASRIFIELICRSVVLTENSAQIKCSPENFAKISFKLAEAFQRVDAERKAPSSPKNQEFDMKSAELPSWKSPGTG
jgi:hypothetical protein